MPVPKLKAVAYNRVSTEEEKQLNALAKQIQENRDVINKQGWEFVREYTDEGKSGTQIKKREGYLRLFEDLEKDDFDIVVIKDQDRLMRNPKDWYQFVDRLLKNNKKLYIYLDHTFYNPDNSLITGIKAILAEEYSRHLSRKINHAHKYRQDHGDKVILTNRTWGYKNTAGKIEVDESERTLIEQIFTMYANGMGSRLICRELSRQGIRNRKGNALAESQIRSIVRNPLYMGTAVMKRTHINFDTKIKEKLPEENWLYHENAVPAIVSGELWKAANERMDGNRKCIGCKNTDMRITGRKMGSNLLSGKIVCGECGQSFWRNKRKNVKAVYWYCSEYYKNGKREGKSGCDSLRLKEEELYRILGMIGDTLVSARTKEELLTPLLQQVNRILDKDILEPQKEEVLAEKKGLLLKKQKLLDLYLEGMLEKQEYQERIKALKIHLDDIKKQEKEIETEREKEKESRIDTEKRKKKITDLFQKEELYNIAIPLVISHMDIIKVYADRIEIYLNHRENPRPEIFMADSSEGKRKFRWLKEKA